MSSATLVVRQYETAAQLSEQFSCALIEVIRVHRQLPGWDAVGADELRAACTTLATVLSAVERAQTDKWGDTPRHQGAGELPEGFTAWLQATHQGDAVKPHALARVVDVLATSPPSLSDADLEVLQRISDVLSAQTAHLFGNVTRHAGAR